MNKKLTCNQISALLNFYVENKLSPRLKEQINQHLEKCPHCKKKIKELQKILENYRVKVISSNNFTSTPTDLDLHNNLSAYIDNELSGKENLKIRKMTISNPNVRKELESLYKYQQVMQAAYTKTKTDAKINYSKGILKELNDDNDYTTTYFYKLAGIFVVLISAIIVGFIYLYF